MSTYRQCVGLYEITQGIQEHINVDIDDHWVPRTFGYGSVNLDAHFHAFISTVVSG